MAWIWTESCGNGDKEHGLNLDLTKVIGASSRGLEYRLYLAATAVLDPRIQLHRQFSWGRWHIGLGRYHQSPPFDQPDLQNFAQSNQASTGLEWKISDSVLIGGDIWVKHSTDKWYVDPTGVTLVVDEEAVGGEAYVAARWDRWDGRVGLSSVHSQLLYDGDMYTGPFSQPFFVNAMLGWRSDSWTVGARYRISSGLPLTEPVDAVLDATQDVYIPTYSQFPQGRMPNYQKIDVQVARIWTLRTSVLKAYCEAWAVPSSGNYLYPIYNYNLYRVSVGRWTSICPTRRVIIRALESLNSVVVSTSIIISTPVKGRTSRVGSIRGFEDWALRRRSVSAPILSIDSPTV